MLTIRRIGIRSYYSTAGLALLASGVLFELLNEVVGNHLFGIVLYSREVSEAGTSTRVHVPAIVDLVARLLSIVATAVLGGWLFNLAARLVGGLKFDISAKDSAFKLRRISPTSALKMAVLVVIPFNAVRHFMELVEVDPFILFSISLRIREPLSAMFVLTILINSLFPVASMWLIVLFYNRIAAMTDGFAVRFCWTKSKSGLTHTSTVRTLQVRLFPALYLGVLLGLAYLLVVGIHDVMFGSLLVDQQTNQLPQSEIGTFSLGFIPLHQKFSLLLWLHPILFATVVAREVLYWPLALLLFNLLARRFGGLVVEVAGDWPAPVAAGEKIQGKVTA